MMNPGDGANAGNGGDGYSGPERRAPSSPTWDLIHRLVDQMGADNAAMRDAMRSGFDEQAQATRELSRQFRSSTRLALVVIVVLAALAGVTTRLELPGLSVSASGATTSPDTPPDDATGGP